MPERGHRAICKRSLETDLGKLKEEFMALRNEYRDRRCDRELTSYRLSAIQRELDFVEVKLAMLEEQGE